MNNDGNYRNVMDYLIKKLEARSRYMTKIKAATNTIGGYEDFRNNKRDMIKQFTEIEDDLTQSANALRALILQNRDLCEQMQQNNMKMQLNESKIMAEMKMMNEISEKDKFLQQEITTLRRELSDRNAFIGELEETLFKLERHIEQTENERDCVVKSNMELKEEIQKLRDENTLLKMQVDFVKKEEDSQHNLKNIIIERENNKKKISEKIKNHLREKTTEQKNTNKVQKTDLLLRISNSIDCLNHLNNLFGSDFMSKIIDDQVDDNYLINIEQELNNFERAKKYTFEENFTEKNNDVKFELINEENEEDEVSPRISVPEKTEPKSPGLRKSKSTSALKCKPYVSFEKSLRDYSLPIRTKVFKATDPGGRYFDDSLIKGGPTQLDISDRNIKRNKLNKSTNL
jgi:chromosome segregation ATPase